MASRRMGAPGSFGAPLDELLPRLGATRRAEVKIDIHRKPADSASDRGRSGECRIFLLNQTLYERGTR